jgi:hypothetical protein
VPIAMAQTRPDGDHASSATLGGENRENP